VTPPIQPVPGLPPGYTDGVFLAHGGSGSVYRARSEAGGLVAIKVLDGHDRRWRRELKVLARLDGIPGVVAIVDSGALPDGRPYLVTPFHPAGTLADLLEGGRRFTPAEVAAFGVELAAALDEAHHRGVTHCDIKPSNVLIDEAGKPLLADFGISRMAGDGTQTTDASETFSFTLLYTAPEVLAGGRPDERSDQYALGLTLVTMLSGDHPFAAALSDGIGGFIDRARSGGIGDLGADGVPDELATALHRATAADPAERWPGLQDLASALAAGAPESLTAAPSHRRRRRRRTGSPPRRAVAVAAAVAVVAAGTGWWTTRDPTARIAAPTTTRPAPPPLSAAALNRASDRVTLSDTLRARGGYLEIAMFVPGDYHRLCLPTEVADALPFGTAWCDTNWEGDGRDFAGPERIDPTESRFYVRVDLERGTIEAAANRSCSRLAERGPQVCGESPATVAEGDGGYSTRFRTDWKSCGEDPILLTADLPAECLKLTGQWYKPGEDGTPYVNASMADTVGDDALRVEFNFTEPDSGRGVPRMTHDARLDLYEDGTLVIERDCWPALEVHRVDGSGAREVYRGEIIDLVASTGGPKMPVELNGAKDKECTSLGRWDRS